ncbi:hypothetical protein HD553DRAFT_344015 [Filobasidium floriforme]|uniref:uncharacterized protein n=1 Tax=Filobasidium floriforme TaxID=5210 RepID=UPI001E8E8E3B|nr:uncharacterized protein HD553DRAFT_344015 [Filobasidium floriforme]KAH8081941.1 hypothetical protein HD553DRAFT_344015 [Filobasidium floriforme]
MPKVPFSTASPTKAEPYPKGSPSKQKASPTTKDDLPEKSSPSKKGITWTDDMDKKLMIHVLSRSEITLRYDWADAVKNEFPDLSVKQLENRWNKKLKNALFPPEVIKLNKAAKVAAFKPGNAKAEAEAAD